jgi:hypothetical protein
MYSIRQIAEAVEKTVPVDHLTPDQLLAVEQEKSDYIAGLDKALRNLSQRVYLPAAERKGRVDLYDHPTVAAFALIISLSDFDIPRHTLQSFAKWAQEPGGPAFAMNGSRRATPIEEAVQRLGRGEHFTFEILGAAFGRKVYRARWTTDEEHYQEVDASRPAYPSIRIPASELIQTLFNGLDG